MGNTIALVQTSKTFLHPCCSSSGSGRVIYYPFVKVYDEQILKEGDLQVSKTTAKSSSKLQPQLKTMRFLKSWCWKRTVQENNIIQRANVLVLCCRWVVPVDSLANTLNKAAAEYNVPVKSAAGGYSAHREMLLTLLFLLLRDNFKLWRYEAETDKLGIKLAKTGRSSIH